MPTRLPTLVGALHVFAIGVAVALGLVWREQYPSNVTIERVYLGVL
jgi:hypothetical protein